jgi:hypothetical protein
LIKKVKDVRIVDEDLSGLKVKPEAVVINKKVNVAVPNLGLLTIEHVKVEEDCCTEQLQHELNHGWRIIAICPQPDQRRPDYILGRTTKEEDDE